MTRQARIALLILVAYPMFPLIPAVLMGFTKTKTLDPPGGDIG